MLSLADTKLEMIPPPRKRSDPMDGHRRHRRHRQHRRHYVQLRLTLSMNWFHTDGCHRLAKAVDRGSCREILL